MSFIELPGFGKLWRALELTDKDLSALQIAILLDPKGNEVVPGSGGMRKIRFSPPGWDRGKRGALRCYYICLDEHHKVLLLTVFPKSEKADLTKDQLQKLRSLIETIEHDLST